MSIRTISTCATSFRPDVSVYYNIDDYALYWPRQAERVRELERAMVRSADADGLRLAAAGR